MKRTILAAAVVTAALGLTVSSAQAGNVKRSCGDQKGGNGVGWYDAKSVNTKCAVAREVAERYWSTGDSSFDGWTCFDIQVGDDLYNAKCVRKGSPKQKVKFTYGA